MCCVKAVFDMLYGSLRGQTELKLIHTLWSWNIGWCGEMCRSAGLRFVKQQNVHESLSILYRDQMNHRCHTLTIL